MTNLLSMIPEYFSYPFIKYAFIVGILTSLSASLLGVILVLKRYSFIGDGLSHVAFGALALASVLKISNNTLIVMPITALFAVFLLHSKQGSKIRGDAALAMVSVGTLAIGYLLMNIFPSSSNINGDVCSTLFGSTSILALSQTDVIVCGISSVVVILMFVLFYNKIFSVTFDEAFASSCGINTKLITSVLAIVSAIIIVLAMNFAGSLLTSALIVFPAISSMRIFKSFKSVLISSALTSVVCAIFGLFASLIFSAPIGSCVVVANIIAFIIFSLLGKFLI